MRPWEYAPKPKTFVECAEAVPEVLADPPPIVDASEPVVHEGQLSGKALPPVRLPSILLLNLMAWVAKFHGLRLEHPTGLILDARPEHVRDAAELHPWGVVYDPERYLLASWGDVPTWALVGKRDLATGELLIPEAVAA